jgi:hypothetical protein
MEPEGTGCYTYSMEQSPWKAYCFAVSQEIHRILWNPKVLVVIFTPWSRVLEKLTVLQLVKKFPAFYGTRRYWLLYLLHGAESLKS